MDKTIERSFFKAYSFGGVLHMCFDWMMKKYDLGFYLNREDEKKAQNKPPEEWEKFYDEILPQRIKEAIEAFDRSVIESIDSPLMDEIAGNLDECQNDMQRERYVFSLLKPFKEYSDKFHPISEIKKLKGEVKGIVGIKDTEQDLGYWNSILPNEPAAACKEYIEECKYRIERTNFVANRYRELLGSSNTERWLQDGTVENCMSTLRHYLFMFARRLDALLLERGINLLWYQNECGIYLYEDRCISHVMDYIGSYELASKYIEEALPKYPESQSENDMILPSELDTEKARKYFTKAIEAGYIKRNNSGYKWEYGGNKGQVRLGYFCSKVYDTQPRPINKLETTFGVKKLSASITSASYDAKTASVKQWKKEINDTIFND
ncbi:MAG: hypothetical protein PHI48_06250 [Bacteroidales bacterium]|nr:hypothetical protein [Bacteroidales bacterium]